MIIPTPKYVKTEGAEGRKEFSAGRRYRIFTVGEVTERVRYAAQFLARNVAEQYNVDFRVVGAGRQVNPGELDILIVNDSGAEQAAQGIELEGEDRRIFDSPIGKEQGYVIKSLPRSPLLLYARNDIGCLYAASSAIQLFDKRGTGAAFPIVTVRDFPDFRYRGNNWLIWAEGGVWSYDRGDGLDAYEKRITRKLDMSLLYKVNLILFDGVGWCSEKSPGYGALMRRLNKKARLRGVKLHYGGYQEGYGAAMYGAYHGKVFRNRRSYPDGEIYPCCGGFGCTPVTADHPSRSYGTCMSNDELAGLKQQELEEFVRNVEPGMMFIHSLDLGTPGAARKAWKLRCAECKKRWPNEDILAEDGLVGAKAHQFNSFAEAVARVRKPGYDGAKDCVVALVGPVYGCHNEYLWKESEDDSSGSDYSWRQLVRYLEGLNRLLRDDATLLLGVREDFYNRKSSRQRIAELGRRLRRRGKAGGPWDIWFYGADGALSDHLFLAVPVLSTTQQGAEALLHGSGHAFQEPQQLLNAEYAWNCESSVFYREQLPIPQYEFARLYGGYCNNKRRPAGIFNKCGFLHTACEKLYGKRLAGKMYEIYKLRGKNGEPPVCYACNLEFGMGVYGRAPRWEYAVDEEIIKGTLRRLREVEKTTQRADEIMQSIRPGAESPDVQEEMLWLKKSFACGAKYCDLFRRHYEVFAKAADLLKVNAAGKEARAKLLRAEIGSLQRDVHKTRQWVERTFSFEMIDPFGGDNTAKREALAYLDDNLAKMLESVRTGERKRLEPERFHWW